MGRGTPERIVDERGYARVKMSGHPHANWGGYVYEHVVIAERALGKPLPPKVVVHHVDRNGANNAHTNLIICENQAYHYLLHLRTRAYVATGDPTKLRCMYCRRYDDANTLRVKRMRKRNGWYTVQCHRDCHTKYERERRRRTLNKDKEIQIGTPRAFLGRNSRHA